MEAECQIAIVPLPVSSNFLGCILQAHSVESLRNRCNQIEPIWLIEIFKRNPTVSNLVSRSIQHSPSQLIICFVLSRDGDNIIFSIQNLNFNFKPFLTVTAKNASETSVDWNAKLH